MKTFKKPTILLSSCIEYSACRYDGSMISNSFIRTLKPYVNFITVCPEVGIGLGIPRQALRVILSDNEKKLVFSKTGEEVTDKINDFSKSFIEGLSSTEIHGAILKSRSPSCGIKDVKVYKNYGKAFSLPEKTKGCFGKKIKEEFKEIPIEDEGRLTNFNIREHFLTRIFTYVNFLGVKEKNSIKALIQFHSENKYLLMAYSPSNLKKLGKIVAGYNKKNLEELLNEYGYYLNEALAVPPSTMRSINMLQHLFGYFSKELTKDEKAFFLDHLESYRNKKVPFSVPLAIIHTWTMRFQNNYLLNQRIFEAFPKEILDVTDSGKGI